MRVLFLIFHPVDPYIVFETAKQVENSGGKTIFLVIEKEDIIKKIIDSRGFENKVIGKNKKSFTGKIFSALSIIYNINKIIREFKPTIVFSPAGPYASFALKFRKLPLICWEDTETATFNYKYAHKRIDSLLLVDSFYKELTRGDNVIRFNGYKELAYLHPNVFKPDSKILNDLGLSDKDTIILMRFSALNAMHDVGLKSEVIDNRNKILDFIERVEKKFGAKVFISMTERELDARFSKYKLNIPPEKYTQLLAFCTLYLGEGTTTASEAGVLGVPWINIQKTKRGYLIDQEVNYGLGMRTDNLDVAFKKAEILLKKKNIKQEWSLKREKLLSDKIDVSAFLTWFIMKYPESEQVMKRQPTYQNNFR
jgi:hypothetical protein